MISVSGMKDVEKRAKEIGISEAIMMENAGANAARIVNRRVGLKGKRILIFCGTGNNAGDGLVFARHSLVYGGKVDVYFVKGPEALRSETARKNFAVLNSLKSMGHPVRFHSGRMGRIKADILVDALLGTGLKGRVSEEYAKVIKKFNESDGLRVSLDCPSGVNSDTGEIMGSAVRPDITITFYDRKKGLNRKNSGEIIIADIGFPKI